MVSLQEPERVLYTGKLKESLNMTVTYKEDLFLFKLCLGATLLHDYGLQKKTQVSSEGSPLRISKECCKAHMGRHTWMNDKDSITMDGVPSTWH